MSILLEVSIAEAIDKLTILDIKYQKIIDSRKEFVKKEYDYLLIKLKEFIDTHQYFYNLLKDVNLEIWELQDKIREEKVQSGQLTELILNLNDSRFIIKNKINNICNSNFLEQKGYSKRIVNFKIDGDLNIHLILNPSIRYLSLFYDQVNLIVDENLFEIISKIYKDDITISINKEILEENVDILNYPDYSKNLITHSFFKNINNINNNDNIFTEQVNVIYNNLNLDIIKCFKYVFDNTQKYDIKNIFIKL